MMRRFFLLYCLTGLSIAIHAQTWTIGARWFYSQEQFMPGPGAGYLRLTKIGDTLLQNQSYSVIEREGIYVNGTTVNSGTSFIQFYLRQAGQRVYQYNPSDSLEYLLYDFSKNTGDTLQIFAVDNLFSSDPVQLTLRVDSVSVYNGASMPLKVQWVRQLDFPAFRMEGALTERIGWSEYLIPRYAAADPAPGGWLLCFRDSFLVSPANALSCGTVVAAPAAPNPVAFSVFPNPTTGSVAVQGDGIVALEVYDSFGRRLLSAFPTDWIDLHAYADGRYVVKARTNSGIVWRSLLKTGR